MKNRLPPLSRGWPLLAFASSLPPTFLLPYATRRLQLRLQCQPYITPTSPTSTSTSTSSSGLRQPAAIKRGEEESSTLRLSQPTKYNPPSHPPAGTSSSSSSLSSPYGRSYSFPTPPRQDSTYPHMLPPEGTFAHWFITNRRLHFYLSLSVLFILAGIISITNFLKTSPYADLVPAWSWGRPVECLLGFWDAVKLHMENESREAEARRKKKVEEIEKRGEYRRKHGLEREGAEGGFGGWSLRRGEKREENQGQGQGQGQAEGEN